MRLGWLARHWYFLSSSGLVLGTLFFVASLTPTLIPRTYLTQGVLSGCCFAVGYASGAFLGWLWGYLELPVPRRTVLPWLHVIVAGFCSIVVAVFLWRASQWQNSIRHVMNLDLVTSAHPFRVCAIAIVTFLSLIALGRCFQLVFRTVATRIGHIVPRRVANVVGVAAAILLFWSVANGVIFRAALHLLDSSFEQADALIPPDSAAPTDMLKAGSPASLIAWEKLGRAGRDFISSGPTAEEIHAFTGREAMEPIRVYVGLPAAETAPDRASLALEELKRVDAFSRAALVVFTPTGTGWIDPAAADTLEYLYQGDIATVAQQYSYLSSPLSLLIEPEYGSESARALFSEIYEYWTALPKSNRPKLYLHGLSLGAMNSERSVELFELLGDPIQGALWSGPPFGSTHWRAITEARNTGSLAWLPQFRDSTFVRFMNQNGTVVPQGTPWGPLRIVYLQYASDPVTFFDYRDLYRAPAWMAPPRGPDVSPDLRWYPVVSMLQLALDMAMATAAPVGYGHVYAPQHYIDAWLQVTGIEGWTGEDIARLKKHLTKPH